MEHHVVIVQDDIIVDDEHMDLVQVQINEFRSVVVERIVMHEQVVVLIVEDENGVMHEQVVVVI